MSALPPAPASSSAVVCQPLCSPSAHHQYGVSTAGLPSSPWLENPLTPPPASEAHRPSGSTSAPSSLTSTVTRRSTSSTLVLSRSGSATDLHLGHQSPRLHSGPPDPRHPPGSLALRLHLRLLHHLLRRRWSAPGVGSHSSSMAPPSIGSTMGRHYGCGLCPAWLLPLRVPPVFSLAPPSFVATLVSARRPPPGDPSSSWPSSLGPIRPSSSVVLRREDVPSRKGAICQEYGPVFCSVFPYLIMFLSSFSLIISWFPTPVYPSFSLKTVLKLDNIF